jgi:hypothetical protein
MLGVASFVHGKMGDLPNVVTAFDGFGCKLFKDKMQE